ncbi:unnamed protein product [Angiostrongylus costaricensis]|uniref:DNA-directed RNA polymerase n=1 Tax=Angiostrongylus costaricensis TaxID=334426 RepID=A0A0R3PZB5_ANGCS|nr:unnamed protein product [Angiostrongylus costaricensis]
MDGISSELWQVRIDFSTLNASSDENGVARLQLDSFDEFIQMNVQGIVEDAREIENSTEFSVKFQQVSSSKSRHWEKGGTPAPIVPNGDTRGF